MCPRSTMLVLWCFQPDLISHTMNATLEKVALFRSSARPLKLVRTAKLLFFLSPSFMVTYTATAIVQYLQRPTMHGSGPRSIIPATAANRPALTLLVKLVVTPTPCSDVSRPHVPTTHGLSSGSSDMVHKARKLLHASAAGLQTSPLPSCLFLFSQAAAVCVRTCNTMQVRQQTCHLALYRSSCIVLSTAGRRSWAWCLTYFHLAACTAAADQGCRHDHRLNSMHFLGRPESHVTRQMRLTSSSELLANAGPCGCCVPACQRAQTCPAPRKGVVCLYAQPLSNIAIFFLVPPDVRHDVPAVFPHCGRLARLGGVLVHGSLHSSS